MRRVLIDIAILLFGSWSWFFTRQNYHLAWLCMQNNYKDVILISLNVQALKQKIINSLQVRQRLWVPLPIWTTQTAPTQLFLLQDLTQIRCKPSSPKVSPEEGPALGPNPIQTKTRARRKSTAIQTSIAVEENAIMLPCVNLAKKLRWEREKRKIELKS